MNTFSSVIDAFGGPASFSAATGIPAGHVRAMKTRNSISPGYWRRVATAAAEKGIAGITFEKLAGLAAAKAEAAE